MSTFQILMFAATLFFAYQIYRHVQTLEDAAPPPQKRGFSSSELVEKADHSYERGELGEARGYLAEAAALEPANPEVLNKLAFVTAKNGDRREAIELYERSLGIDENDDLTHNAIASLYRTEGAFERAEDHYLKALEIDDAYPQTFFNYANLLVDMDETEKARSLYERALELQPDFPEAKAALAGLEVSHG